MVVTVRRVVSAALVASATSAIMMIGSTSAVALPPADSGQSQVVTYYSDASRTQVVGGWTYGDCLEDERWGRATAYLSIREVNCSLSTT